MRNRLFLFVASLIFLSALYLIVEDGFLPGTNSEITGLVVATEIIMKRLTFSFVLLIISIILLICTYWYFAKGPFKNKTGFLSYVLGLEVYTDNGMKIGKVYDLIIENNKVYGLAVALDKSINLNYNNLLVRYEFVQNIKDVVVVNSKILETSQQGTTG